MARLDDARAEAQKMLGYALAEGDRRLEAEAHAEIAYSYYMALSWDRIADLETHVRLAFDIARDVDDDRLIARTLFLMASVDQMSGAARGRRDEVRRVAGAGAVGQLP